MTSFKSLLLASSLLALSLIADVQAAGSTSIKVAVSFPTGSAGASVSKLLPASTKISPCTDALKFDAATFTVTYNAADPASTTAAPLPPLNTYVFFYNPDGGANKFYSVSKGILGGNVTVTAYASAALLTAGAVANPYLSGANNFGVSGTESLFGSYILIDGAITGTWQLIGILADPAVVDFENPATWTAWDVATVMFGMPWKGTGAGPAACV